MKCQEAREDKVLSCQEVYVWYKDKHTLITPTMMTKWCYNVYIDQHVRAMNRQDCLGTVEPV